MIEVNESLTLRRPAAEVFTFLTTIDNFKKWQEGIVSVELLDPGPWRVGTRIKTVHSFLLWNNLLDFSEIIGLEINRRISNRGNVGKTAYQENFSLEDRGEETRLVYRAEIRAGGIFSYIKPLAAWSFRNQMRRSLGKLKRILEDDRSVSSTRSNVADPIGI